MRRHQRSSSIVLSASLLVPLLLLSCRNNTPPAANLDQSSRTIVAVAAAANLKFAFDELESEFEQQHPKFDAVITYGSSGHFFAQLTQGAPFDIFFSADANFPQQLVERKLASEDSTFTYAHGRIVVWVRNESVLDLDRLGLHAVVDPSVRKIAIANPRLAPYGVAAQQALNSHGLYEEARDRFVLGENITQAAHFVESGAADVGILALSLAVAPRMQQNGRFWEIPADAYEPIQQAGVILNSSSRPQAAEMFRDFVTRPEGQAILARFGYSSPDE